MIAALLVGTAVFLVVVVCNAAAIALIVRVVEALLRRGFAEEIRWKSIAVLVVLTLLVAAAHVVQIALWAGAFMACGEFDDFERAVYHSAVNYTTLGYGDIVMSPRWRLLGPLEALNGVLLLGLSTALMFAVMSRLVRPWLERHQARLDAARSSGPTE
jgi:carbon starvation protein CstA